jgi:hypothetical protein
MSHPSSSTILTAFSSNVAFQPEESPTVALGGLSDPFSYALSELAGLDLAGAALTPPSRALDDVGGLDARMLFADLPMTAMPVAPEAAAPLASLIAPPRAISARPSQVATVRNPRGGRSSSSSARSARASSARTLGYIACGALALLATLAACVFYVQRPVPELHATAHVAR